MKTPGGPDVEWNGTGYVVPPGGEIHWTIDVVHDDPASPAAVVTIDDYLPDPADFPVLPFSFPADVLSAPATGTLSLESGWLHDRNIDMTFGASAALVFRTRLASTAPVGSMICNLGLVNYLAPPPPPGLASPTYAYTITPQGDDTMTCVMVSGDPNLAATQKVAADASGDGVVQSGERVDYTITVRNVGSADALDVTVSDPLDGRLTPGAIGQGGVAAGGSISWDRLTTPALGRVRPGESVVLTFSATAGCAGAGAALCNQALVAATGLAAVGSDDPGDAALSSPTCLPVASSRLAGSPLIVTDASGDGLFEPGEALSFELLVTNSGSDVARDVAVTLPVPSSLIDIVPRAGGVLTAGQIRWDSAADARLAAIAPGATAGLGFDAVIDPGAAHDASACATAILESSPGCPAESSDQPALPGEADSTCFAVYRQPLLALETAVSSGPAGPGDMVDIEATVRWVEGATATDVAVSLLLPATPMLTNVVAADGGSVAGGTITWDAVGTPALATLGAGASLTLRATAQLPCDAPDLARPCLTGTASASNASLPVASDDAGLPGPADPSCFDVAAPVLRGELSLAENDGDGAFEPGESLTGSLVVSNAGSASARDVSITLPIPATDLDILASDGGLVAGGILTWDAASTAALASLEPAASVTLIFTGRIDPGAAGNRACHQATLAALETTGCPPALSDDPSTSSPADPACFDVFGDSLPPGEVPDGDPNDGGPEPVRLRRVGPDLLLTWAPAPRALTHVVYRGGLASFRTRPWENPATYIDDPEDPVPSCDLSTLSYTDAGQCLPGVESHYYLVAGRNLVGEGSLGESQRSGLATERPAVARSCP